MRRVLQGGAHATALAGVGDQEIVLALVAVGAGEAMRKDAAFEIAAEGSLDMGRRCFTVLAAGELQPGFEVGLDDAIRTAQVEWPVWRKIPSDGQWPLDMEPADLCH